MSRLSFGRPLGLYIKKTLVLLPVLVSLFLVYALIFAVDVKKMEFKIQHLWNGDDITHDPVQITVKADSIKTVKIGVQAPLFNDPGAPPCQSGKACPHLWDYEVVEVFFLGKDDKYLEIELCPHGQHLVLLLNGQRKMFKDMLDLQFASTKDEASKTWTGTAIVPIEYFPPEVKSLNAYAIHGSGENRQYEALYPATKDFKEPDFHRLQFFKSVDFNSLFPSGWSQITSDLWKEAS